MQKLKRAPFFIVGLSIVFSAFVLGYYLGQHYRQDSFYVSLQRNPPPSERILAVDGFAQEEERININTATAQELCELKGIGPVIAERIIEYREENGGFNHTFEIMNVTGIGKAVYENNKENIKVE